MEYFKNFESSNIYKIGYELSTYTLEVEFQNRSVYQYFDVPEQIWKQFKIAESKGKFLHDSIKGSYRYSRV
jgi:hypothetical protein